VRDDTQMWWVNTDSSYVPRIKERYSHFAMADPSFDQPKPIDLLICVDLYPVMEGGKIVIDNAYITLQLHLALFSGR